MTKRAFWMVLISSTILVAQEQGGAQQGGGAPGGATGPAAPGAGNVPGGNTGRLPGTGDRGQQQQGPFDPSRQQQQFPDMMQRPIFLSGKVMLEDGTPPPEPVQIERVCHGNRRPEAWTDSKGRFSFQLGQNQHMMADASVSSGADSFGGFGNQGSRQGNMGGPMGQRVSERDLMGCEIQASLPGYRSEVVNLSGRRMMDNPDVGTILMKRIAGVEGLTTSMTTLQAPKDAKKAFDKSKDLFKRKKMAEAQKELEKAVQIYPKYAVAWFQLGLIHQEEKRVEEARSAYQQALTADAKYVNPYLQLATISLGEQKWQDVADHTNRLIKLNPVDFPQAFFYNSVANYNLQKFDLAEESAREAVKLDTHHRMPKAQHILGVLLAMKNDYSGAAEHMRGYLQFAPMATDSDVVRKQLGEIEKRLGQTEVGKQQ